MELNTMAKDYNTNTLVDTKIFTNHSIAALIKVADFFFKVNYKKVKQSTGCLLYTSTLLQPVLRGIPFFKLSCLVSFDQSLVFSTQTILDFRRLWSHRVTKPEQPIHLSLDGRGREEDKKTTQYFLFSFSLTLS